MKKIILASGSPRRQEILQDNGINFKLVKPNIDEKISKDRPPWINAMALAFEKARDVANKAEGKILSADTLVYLDREIFEKPKDEADAYRILSFLSDKTHSVVTGFAIYDTYKNLKVIGYDITRVKFKRLKEEDIFAYIKMGEPMDKAGAYGIQGHGGRFVQEILGSYENVVGLPIEKIGPYLKL